MSSKLRYWFSVIIRITFVSSSDLIFNGCNSSLWTHQFYSTELFSHDTDCIVFNKIQSDADQDKILPTLWFDVGSESDIYYNISYDINCEFNNYDKENYFYVLFRVQSVSNNIYEYNDKSLNGYTFLQNVVKNQTKYYTSKFNNG